MARSQQTRIRRPGCAGPSADRTPLQTVFGALSGARLRCTPLRFAYAVLLPVLLATSFVAASRSANAQVRSPDSVFGANQGAEIPAGPGGNAQGQAAPAADDASAEGEDPAKEEPGPLGSLDVEKMLSPNGMTSTLKLLMLLTVLSLAPSILMMTTCFIRFVVVLSLLRQALGTQQLPPNQVIVSLCMFLTFMVMAPVWQEAYETGVQPYTNPAPGADPISLEESFTRTAAPLRQFMSDQIEKSGNSEVVWMFLKFQDPATAENPPETYDDVPLTALLPSYMLSELKVAFVIGFQLYLPFLVIDMVVSSVLISMGMMMLPPVLISLPFKLLLFVLIDGWFLTIGMLLESVRPFG